MIASCPTCGAKLKASDSRAGQVVNCPQCREPVRLGTELPSIVEIEDPVRRQSVVSSVMHAQLFPSPAPLPIHRGPLLCPCCEQQVGERVAHSGQDVICRSCGSWFTAPTKNGGSPTVPARWPLSVERDVWVSKNVLVMSIVLSIVGSGTLLSAMIGGVAGEAGLVLGVMFGLIVGISGALFARWLVGDLRGRKPV